VTLGNALQRGVLDSRSSRRTADRLRGNDKLGGDTVMNKKGLVAGVAALVLCAGLNAGVNAADEGLAKIVVDAGKFARMDTPVSVPLTQLTGVVSMSNVQLVEIRDGKRIDVPCQIEAEAAPRLWWVLSGKTEPGARRTFELIKGTSGQAAGVQVVKSDKYIEIQQGDTKVLRYNHAIVPAPQGQSKLYDRGAFIHPLWSPKGNVITEISPPDHIHHVGIWMPWTETEFEGRKVDFWNLGKGEGTVRFVKFLATTSGAIYGGFQTEHDHVALKTAAGEKVVLKEVWDVRVYNVGGPDKGYWLCDFKSTQRCASASPLKQLEYRYGGIGFRASSQWKGPTASYLTSEGKTRENGHATRARWCDMSGAINQQWEGLTMMSHPANFRYPEPMRIWPEPDNYVFFNFAPSQAGDWTMEPGKDYVFQYRFYVHEGKVVVDDVKRIWHDYAEPPQVRIELTRPANASVLFDGRDFSQWQNQDGQPIKWQIVGDAMKIIPGTGSIQSKRAFEDFRMHIEFKIPQLPAELKGQERGNSGVYIQRRYEVQILDSYGLEPGSGECGALYRAKAPDRNVCEKPGEWQGFDIIFRAARFEGQGENAKKIQNARITVFHNGVLIHDNVEIQNKTGAGRPEGPEPGPILLQEHGSEVCLRNIWVVPL